MKNLNYDFFDYYDFYDIANNQANHLIIQIKVQTTISENFKELAL